MKKRTFAVIFALFISIVINAGQTYAQSTPGIRVDVPFDFSANNRTLPAGTYIINSPTDSRLMWRVRSADQKPGAFLQVSSLTGVQESDNSRLTFRRYGDRYFLISFKTSSYQVDLPTSRSEKEFRRTWDDLAKHDVVTIEAVAKK